MTNRLIDVLPDRDRNRMLENCETVELNFGTILCEPDQELTQVYFPLTGFISLVAPVKDHPPPGDTAYI